MISRHANISLQSLTKTENAYVHTFVATITNYNIHTFKEPTVSKGLGKRKN